MWKCLVGARFLKHANRTYRPFLHTAVLSTFSASNGEANVCLITSRLTSRLVTSHHPVNQKVSVARTLFSRANNITSNNEKKIEEFHQITKTLKNNGFLCNKCSIKKYLKTEKLKRFTSILYVQSVSKPISRILTQDGIGVALKPHYTLFSLFRKPKNAINFI